MVVDAGQLADYLVFFSAKSPRSVYYSSRDGKMRTERRVQFART